MTQTAKAKHFKYVESAMHVQVKYLKDVTAIKLYYYYICFFLILFYF